MPSWRSLTKIAGSVDGSDPVEVRIRINTKMSRIRNTAGNHRTEKQKPIQEIYKYLWSGGTLSRRLLAFPGFKEYKFSVVRPLCGLQAVLWNRNFFMVPFRFRLLKSYGSAPVPVLYLNHKSTVFKKLFIKILPFYILSFFTTQKLISFIKFIAKCEWKKC